MVVGIKSRDWDWDFYNGLKDWDWDQDFSLWSQKLRPRLRLTLVSRIDTDTLNRWYQCCKSALDMTQMAFSHWVKCMIFERNKEVMWLKMINRLLKTIWVCETNTYFLWLRPRLLVDSIKVWEWDSSIRSQELRLILRLWIGGLKAWDRNFYHPSISLETKVSLSSVMLQTKGDLVMYIFSVSICLVIS